MSAIFFYFLFCQKLPRKRVPLFSLTLFLPHSLVIVFTWQLENYQPVFFSYLLSLLLSFLSVSPPFALSVQWLGWRVYWFAFCCCLRWRFFSVVVSFFVFDLRAHVALLLLSLMSDTKNIHIQTQSHVQCVKWIKDNKNTLVLLQLCLASLCLSFSLSLVDEQWLIWKVKQADESNCIIISRVQIVI